MSRLIRSLVIATFMLGLAAPACEMCQKLMPAKTIDAPEKGSPEWVIHEALRAALEKNTDDGYKIVRPLLHSEILDSVAAEQHYRTLIFEAFHRKADLFQVDGAAPGTYKLDYSKDDEKPGEIIKIFVVNEKSDMPTPCRLKRDPKANNEWRISNQCSL